MKRRWSFLASSDLWFRPVQMANAPDGALYVLDMYREVIEDPWSFPASIKKYLDFNSGNDRGRIYRVVPTGFKERSRPGLAGVSTEPLVETLAHPNGWHRDTAARLLFERQDQAAVAPLKALLRSSASGLGRMHALYALHGLHSLSWRMPPLLCRIVSRSFDSTVSGFWKSYLERIRTASLPSANSPVWRMTPTRGFGINWR